MALTFNGKEINTVNFNGKEVNTVYFNRNVGYDIVGNPTIVDGVVSGFSLNNYIKTTEAFYSTAYTDFEIVVKFTLQGAGAGILCQGNGASGRWSFFISASDTSMSPGAYSKRVYVGDLALDLNKIYFVKFTLKNSIATISLSEDGANYTLLVSSTIDLSSLTSQDKLYFGRNSNYSSYFNSSIDLNETYIKVNGVTWFNGKQTATTPIWTRSV